MGRYRTSAKKKARQDRESQPSFTVNTLQTRPFTPVQAPQVQPQAEDRTAELGHRLENISFQPRPQVDIMARKWEGIRAAYQAKQVQAKLAIGAVGDKYEQEADQVASQVVQTINTPEQVQREDEEQVQTKPLESIQRDEAPEEEDEELQMKPLLQRREAMAGGDASEELESSIHQAKGSGQSLDPNLQEKMGQAMGADFSSVKVHTDSQSDQLNQSIQAKAFTTGQDIFFRQGAYDPSSKGGQELIAHELTHVVQQSSHQLPKQDHEVMAKAHTVNSIQRKAFIGQNYEKPDNPQEGKQRELINDKIVRRFKDRQEFEEFANDPTSVEGIGKLSDGTWVRLPKGLLVLGESHSSTKVPDIINSTNITKFRYEGIVNHDEQEGDDNNENATNIDEEDLKKVLDDQRIGRNQFKHHAESAYVRYARGLADILEIVKAQKKYKNSPIEPNKYTKSGHLIKPDSQSALQAANLPARLIKAFKQALRYCKTSSNEGLKKFGKLHNENITATMEQIKNGNTLDDISDTPIGENLEELTKLYEEAAKEETGLTTKWKYWAWKSKLKLMGEEKVTIGKRAKFNDYYRDKSMYDTILEAEKAGDRIFACGNAHRLKLKPLLKKKGIETDRDDDFIEKEKAKNKKATETDI
ncbi:hypothetical protein TUMEXPCC7403_01090 [Tumidithrix helvetica PCC 7403]|uniref:eCIS core domain-containing protein n=1 Tax=Tumidithrix helvetica TaxID=3457545 RepID=UPI003CB43494